MTDGVPDPLAVELRGEFAVVRITGPKIGLDSRDSLYRLAEAHGRRKLILNLADVRVLTSAPIGMLINLKRKLESAGGILRLCDVDPEIREILRLTSVEELFSFYATEEDALSAP
jgi:anti-sigma B factor antagonist